MRRLLKYCLFVFIIAIGVVNIHAQGSDRNPTTPKNLAMPSVWFRVDNDDTPSQGPLYRGIFTEPPMVIASRIQRPNAPIPQYISVPPQINGAGH